VSVFQRGAIPDEIPEYKLQGNPTVLDVLLDGNLVSSKSEGKRMIAQNGVRLDGELLTDANLTFPHPGILQVGKRRFLRVTA